MFLYCTCVYTQKDFKKIQDFFTMKMTFKKCIYRSYIIPINNYVNFKAFRKTRNNMTWHFSTVAISKYFNSLSAIVLLFLDLIRIKYMH